MSGLRWYGITLQHQDDDGTWHNVPTVEVSPDPPEPLELDGSVLIENVDGLGKGDAVDLEKEGIATVGDLANTDADTIRGIAGQNAVDAITKYLEERGATLL